uniref:Uncharacterized protein n=1 Tax=Romanomermis culicivorax TaxID=13658 RepID=A0A915L7E5_ROMCU
MVYSNTKACQWDRQMLPPCSSALSRKSLHDAKGAADVELRQLNGSLGEPKKPNKETKIG